jgi:hypothetical protein
MSKCEICKKETEYPYGPFSFPTLAEEYKVLCSVCYTETVERARLAVKSDMRDKKTRGEK